ncbi:2-hydroxymuconate semialdehyde hydrolase [compost metagenome]
MFPAPRQRWIEALASAEADIRGLEKQALIIHGRDDLVIPLDTSLTLLNWLKHSQLHVFGECGHWAQIEHAKRFSQLVGNFLAE